MFSDCYRGRRVLVTGHTGFKGSWLALWLSGLGAQVTGIALPPQTAPNHWELLRVPATSVLLDIHDAAAVREALARARPHIVFHLAAQALVRPSYADPLRTWSTNVMGTANVLEACRGIPDLRAIVVVTSDKCYENTESERGYVESDRLGGHDPYSASKAAAELVAASYRRSFFEPDGGVLLATARAGNVIGGGDWSSDRLIPDLVRAVAAGQPLAVRSPHAVRPWQHVLESLSGYLVLGQRLLAGDAGAAGSWNFGPPPQDSCTVERVLEGLQREWPQLTWIRDHCSRPHETGVLRLDSSNARGRLGWQSVWGLEDCLRATAEWYQAYYQDRRLRTHADLEAYVAAAAAARVGWAAP